MSMQTQIPAAGLGEFWRNITGARRRNEEAAAPQRREKRRVSPAGVKWPPPISMERAAAGQQKRRFEVKAEGLAEGYVAGLRRGDYAYRILKAEFDAFCEEAEIGTVSNQLFARWLGENGGVKYRAGKNKITMYHIAPRRLARAA